MKININFVALLAVIASVLVLTFALWYYRIEEEIEIPESTVDMYYRTSTDRYPGRLTTPTEVNP